MGTSDLWIRDLITKYALVAILLVILSGLISWKWSRFRQRHFKSFLLSFESECAELASGHKKSLFAPLLQLTSKDEALIKSGRIRVLEIGVKTGDNIQYYPEGSHFIGVDWNRKLGDYLVNGNRSWQFSHVILERLITGDGSSLKMVPSEYVDAVVTTRSLCSTKSVSETLKEIRRVLAPGGKYFFLEHVPEEHGSFIGFIQAILTKTRIWPSLFGGCRLDSNPVQEIEKSGFKECQWDRIVLKGYVSQPHHLLLSRHHIIGTATR